MPPSESRVAPPLIPCVQQHGAPLPWCNDKWRFNTPPMTPSDLLKEPAAHMAVVAQVRCSCIEGYHMALPLMQP